MGIMGSVTLWALLVTGNVSAPRVTVRGAEGRETEGWHPPRGARYTLHCLSLLSLRKNSKAIFSLPLFP